ncbi:ABC transporter permease [Amycolatopsis alkalitolerans]|uniref:ABC transporter permease n=1 Tax=Amycolatopsis alkalitolerans TaxID=2547244 RepID=A0A5C4M6Q6_9PSEU|nr:ABC transporter permease [Amycolatopsis alkalitolerans]TNC26487.1 ABC transporter permease [Amycolatopsis alkalitolerans]
MNTLLKVARYHLVNRMNYVGLPALIVTFTWAVNVAVAAVLPLGSDDYYAGGLATVFAFLLALGTLSMTRSLPFGMALGLSRRTYYLGTVLVVAALSVVYGLALALLQLVETASGGWGLRMHYFRVPWILDGPWYLTWATSFVLLVLCYCYGICYGLVYRRWNLFGAVAFVGAQVLVVLAALTAISLTRSWSAVGAFLSTVTGPAFTGMLALVAVALALGGFGTLRRVTV